MLDWDDDERSTKPFVSTNLSSYSPRKYVSIKDIMKEPEVTKVVTTEIDEKYEKVIQEDVPVEEEQIIEEEEEEEEQEQNSELVDITEAYKKFSYT